MNMGRTIASVTVTNIFDAKEKIKINAVADTGAAYLCLQPEVIEKMKLKCVGERNVQTANGGATRRLFGPCEIIVLGRDTRMDVMENDSETPALLGYLILEALDLIVDSKSQKVIPNPASDGEWLVDMY